MSAITQGRIFQRIHVPRLAKLGWRRLLLLCGAASTLLYIALDSVAALRYDGYDYTGQTISELSAIDAPTRSLWVPFAAIYAVLVLAFAYGIWLAAGRRRVLRVVAGLVAVIGLLGLIAWPFAPMHQREVLAAGGGSFSDSLHIALGMVDTLLFLSVIAAGIVAFQGCLRLFSIATMGAVIVAGVLTGIEAPKVADDEPTPWIGVTERISVFGSMVWLAVLGLVLWRQELRSRRDDARSGLH